MIGTIDMTEPASTKATAKERGLASIVAACGVVGLLAVGGAIALSGEGWSGARDSGSVVATEDYGRRLLSQTSELLGPDHPDPAMRYSGIRLACGSCHLGIGAQPGTLSLLQAAEKYPRFSGRDGRESDIVARINGCMTRSMNGRELPPDSVEMRAMVAYVASLGDRYDAMGASLRKAVESSAFVTPARAANVDAARARYDEQLATYKGKTLRAVREVEESLVRLDSAAKREADANAALAGYQKYLTAAEAKVKVGAGSLTELEDARRAVVAAQGAAVGVARERLTAWIGLYKAVGGGWVSS